MSCCSNTLFSSTNRITLTTPLFFGKPEVCRSQPPTNSNFGDRFLRYDFDNLIVVKSVDTPKKLTWNLKITTLKRKIIFQTSIFLVPRQFSVEYLKPLMECGKESNMCQDLVQFVVRWHDKKEIIHLMLPSK